MSVSDIPDHLDEAMFNRFHICIYNVNVYLYPAENTNAMFGLY